MNRPTIAVPAEAIGATHLLIDDQGVSVTDDATVVALSVDSVPVGQALALWGVTDATELAVIDSSRGGADVRVVLKASLPSGRSLAIHLARAAFATSKHVEDMGTVQHKYAGLGAVVPRIIPSINHQMSEQVGTTLAYAETWIDGEVADGKDPAVMSAAYDELLRLEAQACMDHKTVVAARTSWAFIDRFEDDEMDENDEVAHELEPLLADALGGDPRVMRWFASHHIRKEDLAAAYRELPEAAVQGDITLGNALLGPSGQLMGLIDFTLSGMERCVNYLLMQCEVTPTVEGLLDEGERAARDAETQRLFKIVQEHYTFSPAERAILPELYRLRVPLAWKTRAVLREAIHLGRAADVMTWLEREGSRPDEEILTLLG